MIFRDSRGRFVSASPKVRAGLEAMRVHRQEMSALWEATDILQDRPKPMPNGFVRLVRLLSRGKG